MARRRRSQPDPRDNDSVVDALLVARALRHERGGASTGLMETSDELSDRLGFATKADMEAWSVALRERSRGEAAGRSHRRRAEADVCEAIRKGVHRGH